MVMEFNFIIINAFIIVLTLFHIETVLVIHIMDIIISILTL